jgi:hypothetical protein
LKVGTSRRVRLRASGNAEPLVGMILADAAW